MSDLTTIILAAGEGTRMRSSMAKLLHPVAGRSILGHVLNAAKEAGSDTIAVITAPGQQDVQKLVVSMVPDAQLYEQEQRLGTAHAARMASTAIKQATGHIAVVYGDHPLLHGGIFGAVLERLDQGWDASILGFEPDDPTGYGRFVVDGDRLMDIVEHRDADEKQRRIGLCNACILAFRADVFRELIWKVKNDNAQSEYYLGDLVSLANNAGYNVGFAIAPEQDVMGVNSREQLAVAESLFQKRLRTRAMQNGVTLRDPDTTYFSYDTRLGGDITIEPGVVFGPGVRVGNNVTIKAYSHIEGATIEDGVSVGPFARLRPDAYLEQNSRVGNFCEVKKATLAKGAKVSHLSYIGDAFVGENANIGAGTITCNYDGFNKSLTRIGMGAFIGSNTALIAPVSVGQGAIVGAGSTITEDVAPDDLALTRTAQKNMKNFAPRLRARSRAKKDKAALEKAASNQSSDSSVPRA